MNLASNLHLCHGTRVPELIYANMHIDTQRHVCACTCTHTYEEEFLYSPVHKVKPSTVYIMELKTIAFRDKVLPEKSEPNLLLSHEAILISNH